MTIYEKLGFGLMASLLALALVLLVVIVSASAYREIFSEKIELIKTEWICTESRRVWTGKTYAEHCIVYKRHE